MYKNLEAEMARIGLSKKDLAEKIQMPYVTLADKMAGRSRFWYEEAVQIRDAAFPDFKVEYLFQASEKMMA
ncbi:XRE family transcriptional regulator [Planococcus sp. A6]|uniref:XRE family transcriptional regulator n=1 Tax=Planococcus sp. A6 TaxID=2992760 RepID=UPI00237A8B7E|nr:XRE family transcriptional regulator [Planococcus sp. A6]MDE0582201.1 XRE family transcriptional regulator [Planococcus sp. A6]